MDAFDAGVIIYAASPAHQHREALRTSILATTASDPGSLAGVGSLLLLTEVLPKPARAHDQHAIEELTRLLGALTLLPCDRSTIELALDLGTRYGLKTVDAVHLATAVAAGAERFITNNRRHFTKDIAEIDITYPEDLAATPA